MLSVDNQSKEQRESCPIITILYIRKSAKKKSIFIDTY